MVTAHFDSQKMLAVLSDPRPRSVVVEVVPVPRDDLLYQLAGKTRGRIFRERREPAPWYLEARAALSEVEQLALDALEDYQRTAGTRALLKSQHAKYRRRSMRRAGSKAPESLRANAGKFRARLDELFGATNLVSEEAIKAAYLKSAGLKHAELAALLGVESGNTRQTPMESRWDPS